MIDDEIISEQDIEFYQLKKLGSFGCAEIYGRDRERYLLMSDREVSDLYYVAFKFEVREE